MPHLTELHIWCVTLILAICALDVTAEVAGLDDVRDYAQYLRSMRNTAGSTGGDMSDYLMNSRRFRELSSDNYPDQLPYDVINGHDLALIPDNISPYSAYSGQPQSSFKDEAKRSKGSLSLSQFFNNQKTKNGFGKRQQVSVSQLAQLLNNLKTRNADEGDGVKLNNLRFGKRK